MTHATHDMHENSLLAYQREAGKLGERKRRVLGIFRRANRPLTVRDVLQIINDEDGTDIQDPNHVRPRISELKAKGLIVEIEKAKIRDKTSGHKVAAFEYPGRAKDMTLL